MEFVLSFTRIGTILLYLLTGLALAAGCIGAVNLFTARAVGNRLNSSLLLFINTVFLLGLLLICWFHYQIYVQLPLELPAHLIDWLNRYLESAAGRSSHGIPLYDPDNPPRYLIPFWIENEKYYFWFFCYAVMAHIGFLRLTNHRLRGLLLVILAVQVLILFVFADPFASPLPSFFNSYLPWINGTLTDMERIGLFMRLYSKMTFYYNASYMWLHPPMLFLSYGAITVTFVTSVFMLFDRRVLEVEKMGYDFAKFGYVMLTLGMLLGYPWALKAWGPNWWWDPKICSSIMMWAIYSTFMHTRLYGNRASMWYFTSILGIVCFGAMIFTFVSSFLFPGEHTFQ